VLWKFGVHVDSLRFRPGWAWTWELPGIMPWLPFVLYPLAAILVLMWFSRNVWPRSRLGCAFFGVAGLLLLTVGFLISAAYAYERLRLERRIVHLEEPGVYEAAAVVAYGRWELAAELWARKPHVMNWERISESHYPPCIWPFELRQARQAARYLVVDSEVRASALFDFTDTPPHWRNLPSLQDLRTEFGQDLTEVAGRERDN